MIELDKNYRKKFNDLLKDYETCLQSQFENNRLNPKLVGQDYIDSAKNNNENRKQEIIKKLNNFILSIAQERFLKINI